MSLDEPTARRAAADPMVDVVFDVAGTALPREHRAALRDALATWLPWLADDAHIGIHPLKATTIDGDTALLSKRSRLVLRVGASRVAAVRALRGHDLNVGGHSIRLAEERVKPLAPSATLSAAFVATMARDDLAHQRVVERMLDHITMPRRFICGRLSQIRCGDAVLTGASVVLHELAPADSLRLQSIGLGPHRAFGCGLFIPYKAISGLD